MFNENSAMKSSSDTIIYRISCTSDNFVNAWRLADPMINVIIPREQAYVRLRTTA
jgi:hypothetical protein